jgi:hypothetical protein
MSFLAPGWIGLALFAAAAVAGIHLISWRLPRTVVLPTVRFVPDEPARRAARTFRPADLVLLALRVAILLAAGLALARPVFDRTPDGSATVIAVERGGPGADTAAIRGIERTGHTAFVVYDTAVHVVTDASEALREVVQRSSQPSLSVGLLAAIREATRLQVNYDTVRIVVASALTRDAFDNATLSVRAMWPDSVRLVRLAPVAPPPVPVSVVSSASIEDPVMAGIRLAEANGLIRGESRVIRDRMSDVAPRAGETVVIWPIAPNDAQRVDGVHADGATAIGYLIPTPLPDSGRVIARWVNGTPAAREFARDGGCTRSIGFDVPDLGDFALTPAFQRLAAVLLAPCRGVRHTDVAPDSLIRALSAPPVGQRDMVTRSVDHGNRIAALLMIFALLLGALEWWFRRRSMPSLKEQAA